MPPSSIDVQYIKSLSWTTTTSYTARSIITYNIALGSSGKSLPLVFEGHPSFHALPTFGTLPVIAIMGLVSQAMPNFLPDFQPHNHVHGEHFLRLSRPFPREATLRTTARVVDVVDRRSGVTVCVGITTTDAAATEGEEEEEICYNEWTSFVMKVPGKGAARQATKRGAATAIHSQPERPPDAVTEQATSAEQGALYRAASGDLNPLHVDPEVARRGGFESPILTGTCTLGMGVRHVLDRWAGGDVRRFESVKVRLSKPVFHWDGEVVRTEMWKEDGGRRILYRMMVGEKVVIAQAAVELKDVEEDVVSSDSARSRL